MKILVINNNVLFQNEEGLFIHKTTGEFLVDLLETGNEIYVFQFKMKYRENDSIADYKISDKGIKILTVNRFSFKLLAYIISLFKAFFIIRNVDFVYLFVPGNIYTKILCFICIVQNKRFGLYLRGEQRVFTKTFKLFYKKAKFVQTVSPLFTEQIKKIGAKAHTIRPMIDHSIKDIVENRKYNNKDFYKLLYIGRIEKEKGIFEIYEAIYNLVRDGVTNFEINLIGDGVEKEMLSQIIIDNKLSDYIKLLGTITQKEKIESYYLNSDLFIIPSYHEGFPRVIYEAMIFGTPIITSFVGGIPYLMKDGYNCFEVKTMNSLMLSSIIHMFITDYSNIATVAINATKTIKEYLMDKEDVHALQLVKNIESSIE